MKLTYDEIVKFMNGYFEIFNKYGQNPATVHRLDEYYAPDVEFAPQVAGIIHTTGREDFYRVLVSHPSGYEKLTPEDIVVDEKKGQVVVLIKAEICDPKSGEALVTKRYFVLYPLMLDEKNSLKIKKVHLFWEVLPPGALEISDVFARDHK
jgi:hypothetical protein